MKITWFMLRFFSDQSLVLWKRLRQLAVRTWQLQGYLLEIRFVPGMSFFVRLFMTCVWVQGRDDAWHSLYILVDFAFQLQSRLEQINKHSFQNFCLRIGW